jgi:adenylate cyclase
MASQPTASATEAHWRKMLIEGHRPLRSKRRLFRYLPGPPRCKVCNNPFGGPGGRLLGLLGYTPSRKNPNICVTCCEGLPPGGVEIEIAVLFADLRGSTTVGERLGAGAYAAWLNQFYRAATEVLLGHDAIIDKLIGDEVMALFIPGVCGPDYRRLAAEAAIALRETIAGGRSGAAMPMGIAVYSGVAFVGNLGDSVLDFTAVGDTINTAARLASSAAAGEVLFGEAVHATVAERYPDLEKHALTLRGKEAPCAIRVLRP